MKIMKKRKVETEQLDPLSSLLKSRALIHVPSHKIYEKFYNFVYKCLIDYKDFPKEKNGNGEITIVFLQSKMIINTDTSHYVIDFPWTDLDMFSTLLEVKKIFQTKNSLWKASSNYEEFLELKTPKLYTNIVKSTWTFSW